MSLLDPLIGLKVQATIVNGKVVKMQTVDIDGTIDTRRDEAFRFLSRYLPEGATIHCIVEATRTGASSWVRVFTGGFLQTEEPWIIDLTVAVATVLSLRVENRYSTVEPWLFLKGNGTVYRPAEIAERLTIALERGKNSIKGRYL